VKFKTGIKTYFELRKKKTVGDGRVKKKIWIAKIKGQKGSGRFLTLVEKETGLKGGETLPNRGKREFTCGLHHTAKETKEKK